jgi:hypothetical protein
MKMPEGFERIQGGTEPVHRMNDSTVIARADTKKLTGAGASIRRLP